MAIGNMAVLKTIKEIEKALEKERSANRRTALVPTMGFFHDGHLELMRQAKSLADICVVSIFVNPAQFGQNEDLDRYPRDLEHDRKLSNDIGVNYLFTPSIPEMYPKGYSTFVDVHNITEDLCGKSRPDHFRGVATIVNKLLNIVKPDVALFGKKDYQQFKVIQQMVADLNIDVEIVGVPTVREPDGIAMSSRNSYLSGEERVAALAISKALSLAQQIVDSGIIDAQQVVEQLKDFIKSQAYSHLMHLEYLEIRDTETLLPIKNISPESALVAVAAKIGKTRLIDSSIIKTGRYNG